MRQRIVQGKRLVQLRSMRADPQFSFQHIGEKLGFTKQRISQFAKEFGINGRQRERERLLPRSSSVIEKDYLPGIRDIIETIKNCGFRVMPYKTPQPSRKNKLWRSQRMVLVNGVLCSIQVRPARKLRPSAREYARFDVGPRTRAAKAVVFAMRSGRSTKVYVVPTVDLRNVSYLYIPADGRYAVGTGKKLQRDWTRYENAWHLLNNR